MDRLQILVASRRRGLFSWRERFVILGFFLSVGFFWALGIELRRANELDLSRWECTPDRNWVALAPLDSSPDSLAETKVEPILWRIDLNTASLAEFETLPGIGPGLAKRIWDYREEVGEFSDPEELMDVPGIGPKIYGGLSEYVVVRVP